MDGCEDKQSSLIADFAVDVAIVAIQLVVPFFYSQDAARITGRTKPAWTGSVVKSNGQISSKTHRQDPGFALSGGAFEEMLSNGKNTIDSVGKRVAAFIKDDGLLPDLEQSWFDAAYWFHEGLAEPVETIAVAKLETALEVLLSSASTKGSTSRLTHVFSSFYGRHKDQPIADGSAVMVKDFINEIVSSRSRVLAWFAIAAAFSSVPVFLR